MRTRAPTPKQVAFYRLLATHAVFYPWERVRLLTWLDRDATRENITGEVRRLMAEATRRLRAEATRRLRAEAARV